MSDINRIEMKDRIKRMEQLKKKEKEYYQSEQQYQNQHAQNQLPLGGMSMVSQTSFETMEHRKTSLRKANNNSAVAKYLADTYLATRADTPKSVLSASQLPFFSDEDESDSDLDQFHPVNNNKQQIYGTSEIQSEQQYQNQHAQNQQLLQDKNQLPLGGMSMVSQTSFEAMEQRKTFLRKSSNNPAVHVRKGSRAVAKWLANTYLTTDEDESDTDLDQFQHVNNNKQIQCEQRVLRWQQQPQLQEHLNKINEWDFDVFYVVENAGNYAMPAIALTLLNLRGLISAFNLNSTSLCNYFHQTSLEYKNNPYHNSFHGCNVLVNCNYFLNAKLMRNIRK
eukprot:477823_1